MHYIIFGSILTVALFLILIYSHNKFVTQKTSIEGAWSGIDIELKRRQDLIPNLVALTKGYTNFESSTLEAVASARYNAIDSGSLSPSQREGKENTLNGALKGLLAIMESYPDLKASEEFLNLQRELTNTEDRIAAGRRFYNATVRMYEMRIASFPSSIIAKLGGFTSNDFEFFQADSGDTEPIKVNLSS